MQTCQSHTARAWIASVLPIRFNLATISMALCVLFAAAGPASATTATFTLDSNPIVAFSIINANPGPGPGHTSLGDLMVTLPLSPFDATLTVGTHFSSMILDAFADINNTPTLAETITFRDDIVASNTLRLSGGPGSQPLADVTIKFATETVDIINPNGGPIGGGTSAPEPSTLLLLGTGLLGLMVLTWRNKLFA
jgi:hypothetical protein